MPRRPTGEPAHRPLIPIDWQKVDQMVLAGLSGTQIAGILDIHHDTFYDRFRIEKGISFSEYRPRRKEGGDGLLLLKQWQSAMKGNTKMLQLLGEERLGQGKKNISTFDSDSLSEIFNQIDLKRQVVNEENLSES